MLPGTINSLMPLYMWSLPGPVYWTYTPFPILISFKIFIFQKWYTYVITLMDFSAKRCILWSYPSTLVCTIKCAELGTATLLSCGWVEWCHSANRQPYSLILAAVVQQSMMTEDETMNWGVSDHRPRCL
jgi:hypothetical protein